MQSTKVSLARIVVLPDRGRKEFRGLTELADSIKRNGFIHPMLVRPGDGDKLVLVAGERRYRAAVIAQLIEVPVTFRNDITDLDAKILELEENVQRADLSWPEQCELHSQIHEHKKRQDPNWKQEQTAEMVGVSRNHLNLQIQMAKELRDASPELKKKMVGLDINSARKVADRAKEVEKMDRLSAQGKLVVSTDLLHCDCREGIKTLADASVDCVITDPPYGLDEMNDLAESGNSKLTGHQLMNATHNLTLDKVLGLLADLAPQLARVLKPGAHFYVFAPFQFVGDFIKALAPLEFKPPVLVWRKVQKGNLDNVRSTTINYGYNYASAAEAIIYGCLPPQGRRLAKNMSNILDAAQVPHSERVYPTEKPQDLLRLLISQSTILGETVLDPFAGSASTLKAAKALGRRGIGFEIDAEAWKRAQLLLSGVEE